MKHLYDRPRPPISPFEQLVINALSTNLQHLHSIWMRYEQDPTQPDTTTPTVFIVVDRDERKKIVEIVAFLQSFAPGLAASVHINEWPPEAVQPACIYRREALERAVIERNLVESDPRRSGG